MSVLRTTCRVRFLSGLNTRLAEFIHLCAVYLGIAVLVTVVASAVVPSIRGQATFIYHVVVEALRSQSETQSDYATLGELSDRESVTTSSFGPDLESTDAENGASLPPLSAYTEFAQVLQQSSANLTINGVTDEQLTALRNYISRKYRIAPLITSSLIQMAYSNGRDKKVDPLLILAVIAIESTYNPFVESHAGAQGLMQVMTRVHPDKLDMFSEGDLSVFSPAANIQAGTQILADCRKRRGSLTGSLACYVGAVGPSDGGYGAKVLAERRRIALASGIAVED